MSFSLNIFLLQLLLLQVIIFTSGFRIHHRIIQKQLNMQNEPYQNRNFSIVPVNGMTNEYENNLDNTDNLNTAFIPTGPSYLSTVDKSYDKSSSNEKLKLSSRSETAVRYFELVEKLSPNDLLQKFAETAPRNVQEATKSTIVNILGSLPNYALDAAMVTTSSKLANLLYQMQLTGYMFKSAEYRMSLTKSLKGYPKLPSPSSLTLDKTSINILDKSVAYKGKVEVTTSGGEKLEVEADDLMKALSKEVNDLRTELALVRDARETELRSNLLTYIQALPERDMKSLTQDMSEDVVDAIKMLVNALMERLGIDITGPELVIQQQVGALAQLCMWQLVVGYKLRELEAFEKGVPMD